MPVTTLEDLRSIPVGEAISLMEAGGSRVRFTRSQDGFLREGTHTPVEPDFFVGAIQARNIERLGESTAPGLIFGRLDTTCYVTVTEPDEHGQVYYVTMRQGRVSAGPQRVGMGALRAHPLLTDQPPWKDVVVNLGQRLAIAMATAAAAPPRSAAPQVPAEALAFIEDLSNSLSNFDDDDDRDRVQDMLARHGLATTHLMWVRLTGESTYAMNDEDVRRLMGDSAFEDEDSPSTTVSWGRDWAQITKVGVGCLCDDVDEDDIRDLLPGTWDSFDIEAQHVEP